MKVLVCGSRDYDDEKMMAEVLRSIWTHDGAITRILHGGASGADDLAGQWASRVMIPVTVFPALWDVHGRGAGPIRNQEMLEEDPTVVAAFLSKPLSQSKGTLDMVTRARKRTVKTGAPLVYVIGEDDTGGAL